jgi:S-DNA-T family DNA segregation ATPase FtsK/SpoIIIE
MGKSSTTMKKRLIEISGIILLGLSIILFFSLVSYNPNDPSWWNKPLYRGTATNLFGITGANISETFFQFVGLSSFLIPFILGMAGWNLLRKERVGKNLSVALGFVILMLSLSTFLTLLFGNVSFRGIPIKTGGYLGEKVRSLLLPYLNWVGSAIITLLAIFLGIVITTQFSVSKALFILSGVLSSLLQKIKLHAIRYKETRKKAKMRKEIIKKHALTVHKEKKAVQPPSLKEKRPEVALPKKPVPRKIVPSQPALDFGEKGQHTFPPLSYLNLSTEPDKVEEKELMEKATILTNKLKEFDVHGTVVQIHPGPIVTTFEFRPEAGIKYAKITSLVDDLCLGLEAECIRIDRMTGKSTVGIEVPNRIKEIIYARNLIGSEKFQKAKSKLTLALGKTISGDVYIADLEKMPHLLIAGATGTGKSVALNSMISSILYRATPEEVKFIFIDTKMLELGIYRDIPHLLVPVVTDPKAASIALKWATKEMEYRYKLFAKVNARTIEQFNQKVNVEEWRKLLETEVSQEKAWKPLPYIVVVIDELADLMVVSSIDVEESIMRLAQMARAVGIHLLIATQRPSVDVITGIIKANLPARIAFRVSQKVDSRTIIDQNGAEQLLGMGDMLLLLPSTSRLIRLHGALITEPESKKISDFLRKQGRPIYNREVLKEEEQLPGEKNGFISAKDPLYKEAVRLIVSEGQASISHLQRRLRLGYARAARIIDMMEDEGIVGPADGSKPRDVFVGIEYLDSLKKMHE